MLPTRLFHWLLVALVLLAWASWRYSEALGDPTLKLHRWNGHAILVLIVFRLLWGLVGSSTSRFSRLAVVAVDGGRLRAAPAARARRRSTSPTTRSAPT